MTDDLKKQEEEFVDETEGSDKPDVRVLSGLTMTLHDDGKSYVDVFWPDELDEEHAKRYGEEVASLIVGEFIESIVMAMEETADSLGISPDLKESMILSLFNRMESIKDKLGDDDDIVPVTQL